MVRYKFILLGVIEPSFKPQFDWRKKKLQEETIYEFEVESEYDRDEMLKRKYEFVPYWQKRNEIKEKFNLKIPIWVKRLKWKIEEVKEVEQCQ